MKKPDSLGDQLKTIQSERNLARDPEIETEVGTVKSRKSEAATGTDYPCGSVSGVTKVVPS
jgi:hypothetical protein